MKRQFFPLVIQHIVSKSLCVNITFVLMSLQLWSSGSSHKHVVLFQQLVVHIISVVLSGEPAEAKAAFHICRQMLGMVFFSNTRSNVFRDRSPSAAWKPQTEENSKLETVSGKQQVPELSKHVGLLYISICNMPNVPSWPQSLRQPPERVLSLSVPLL